MKRIFLITVVAFLPLIMMCAEDIPIPAPDELKVTEGVGKITLSWYPVIVAEKYHVYYDYDESGPPYACPGATVFILSDTIDPIEHQKDNPIEVPQTISEEDERLEWPRVILEDLQRVEKYYFAVKAIHGSEESEFSEEVSGTPE